MTWIDFCKSFIIKCKERYYNRTGKNLNIDKPSTFTEKIQWLKIYDSTFLKSFCTDKITIHEYCKQKLGKDICIPIIKIYNKPEEINFNDLPDKFVIKCNHGCKMNVIVSNKKLLNIEQTINQLNQWLKKDFSEHNGYELHYKLIPHKILIEEYKENAECSDLIDYKLYCFNGKPTFFQIINDRSGNKYMNHYDINWNYQKQYERLEVPSNTKKLLDKPKQLEQMIKYAKVLSADFKFVRVDFYIIDDAVYLGELTFTPNSGYHKFKDPSIDLKLGELLKI